jgi:hypothetical protein
VAVIGGMIVVAAMWPSDPRGAQRVILAALAPAPWVMAGLVAAKAWGAVWTFGVGRRRGLVSGRFVAGCVGVWAVGTACVAAYACVLTPGIPWARDLIVLAGMLVLPLNRIGAAPLTLAGNRHR